MGLESYIEELKEEYEKRRRPIKRRLKQFEEVWEKPEERVFEELVFCLLAPQSSALACNRAVRMLSEEGKLTEGTAGEIEEYITGARFHKNKAGYIVKARELFTEDGEIKIKDKIDTEDNRKAREWLIENVKGLGYKESSHFLRNIGLGKNLAILDRHIIKNLMEAGVLEEEPKTLTKKRYLEIEKKMKQFSKDIGIPLEELDLLFWAKETGLVFK